nr:MAG TPA: hypothetical protein [Caudoviricetes sp.]DAM43762.1 MAG TPA: hypothetical protein [Caudoviricetes sp.]
MPLFSAFSFKILFSCCNLSIILISPFLNK